MATEALSRTRAFGSEDTGNMLSMEHVNVRIPDQQVATLFYIMGMGFTRDPYMNVGVDNMWINVGDQQFHLPTGGPQVLRGHVGIVVPSLAELTQRLDAVAHRLAGTKLSWRREGRYLLVTCPWRNEFHCYEPAPEFGGAKMGIPYVEFNVPEGAASGIARFYETALQTPASAEGGVATVEAGGIQRLVFREGASLPEYDGHHIAVYINNFSEPYVYLSEHSLVTQEPANHQLRFKDIADPETGQVLFTIEHEVRSGRHPGYRRALVNRLLQ